MYSFLSFSRMAPDVAQVLPLDARDLMYLLFQSGLTLALLISLKRGRDLSHQVHALQHMQCLLVLRPFSGADDHKVVSIGTGHLDGKMLG